jgi:hypothetical protein
MHKKKERKFKPATSIKERQDQMISLAVDLAEEKLRDGTASSQIITHYLELATTKELLKEDIMKEQKNLLKAKIEAVESHKEIEKLYSEALNAMREYSGNLGEDNNNYD